MFVPFEKMPQYLSAADVAVLWRENNVVNNVASPSKFSEFAAMGLYIIHNGSVELAIDYIKKTKAGCVIHDITDVSIPAMSYLKEHRTYWINEGKKYFGINSITKNYLETLNPVQ